MQHRELYSISYNVQQKNMKKNIIYLSMYICKLNDCAIYMNHYKPTSFQFKKKIKNRNKEQEQTKQYQI